MRVKILAGLMGMTLISSVVHAEFIDERSKVVPPIQSAQGAPAARAPVGASSYTPPAAATPTTGEGGDAAKSAQASDGLKPYEVRLTDIKLSTAMQRWVQKDGVRLRWDADKHVLISAPMVFKAKDALDAITQALSTPGVLNSEYPLEVCAYPNDPPLLRITRQGEQSKDCVN